MSKYISFQPGKEIEWLELNLLRTNQSLSKSTITELASDSSENEIDSWIAELKMRSTLYKIPLYDFKENKITPLLSWQDIPEYYLCVYYSFNGAGDNSNGTRLFEVISAQVLKNFIHGEVYTLGFPGGKGLNDYLDEVCPLCNEERLMKANGNYKDDGVDVIGYKLFDDQRSANVYYLLQCAAGQNWRTKSKIELNRWMRYIGWYPENIILSISTVDYVTEKEWNKRSSTFGMLIDRLRIYNFLYIDTIKEELRSEVLNWRNNIEN